MSTLRSLSTGAFVCLAGFVLPVAVQAAEEVNIYSTRQAELIAPLLEAFSAETGIKTNVLWLKSGMAERVAAEAANSPADVLLTVDIGDLGALEQAEVTQAVDSAVINADIPAQYRDPDGHWFALTQRARVVYASRERVPQESISYAELADPKWKGRICIRSGQHPYNIALIASIIAHEGTDAAEKWLAGFKENLARKPGGNDREQAKGIFSGECDIAIGNSYYVGLMMTNEKNPEQKDWAKAIKVLFPDAAGRGTHVNISGMAMAMNAPHPENALKLMEFLASSEAQEIYAEQVFEYPLKEGAQPSAIVAGFGEFVPDPLSLAVISENRKEASQLVDKVGFND